MRDIQLAIDEFKNYVDSNFNVSEKSINRKRSHSLRVMNFCKELSISLGMNDEEIYVAQIIGLLHDIGRFDQWKTFENFKDLETYDHGDRAVELLKENNFIRKFIEDDSYDDIILTAIKNHNKYEIEPDLSEKTLKFCKIIRDADKHDIFYEVDTCFYNEQAKIDAVTDTKLCDEYYNSILEGKQILKKKDETRFDLVAVLISFVFDINFDESIAIIRKHDYMRNTLTKVHLSDPVEQEKFDKIKEIYYSYLETRG